MRMQGAARDLLTPGESGKPVVLAEDRVGILASPIREIVEIESDPHRPALAGLVGCRAGGQSRAELAHLLPEEKEAGTPLYLLLDDFAGASLVAGWAWSRWIDDWAERSRNSLAAKTAGKKGRMEGVCAGFRPGSSALDEQGWGRQEIQSSAPVASLVNPDDPDGWHRFVEQNGAGMRRARWIDIWIEDVVQIELGFQDSATAPGGGRVAVHEYRVAAAADPENFTLLSVDVDPRILPYSECPAASPNAAQMVGTRLGDMREAVLASLSGVAGCTHLNDVLRSMAEVPQLARAGGGAIVHPT